MSLAHPRPGAAPQMVIKFNVQDEVEGMRMSDIFGDMGDDEEEEEDGGDQEDDEEDFDESANRRPYRGTIAKGNDKACSAGAGFCPVSPRS